jgi:hypothetical protein
MGHYLVAPTTGMNELAVVNKLLCALLCVPGLALAQDDCTFDPEDQLRVLAVVAHLYPNGTLDATERRIAWSAPDGGVHDVRLRWMR